MVVAQLTTSSRSKNAKTCLIRLLRLDDDGRSAPKCEAYPLVAVRQVRMFPLTPH
jgi:hypothetical protein